MQRSLLLRIVQGHHLFQSRVGPVRFERRPTIGTQLEIMVGRRVEAPLVPPYRFRRPNKAMALRIAEERFAIRSDNAKLPPRAD